MADSMADRQSGLTLCRGASFVNSVASPRSDDCLGILAVERGVVVQFWLPEFPGHGFAEGGEIEEAFDDHVEEIGW
ncbi:MAG TPA: hypothetical protein VIL87_01825, partial [Dermatophilaceae bacterium]